MLRALFLAITLMIATTVWLTGVADPFEEQLRIQREGLSTRSASGQVHVAAIDPASIAALKNWPWPRETHATLVDTLRAAGATTIAFDIDFSSPSTPQADAALAAALTRSGNGVILPTFRQRRKDGTFSENLPIPQLRPHGVLASVNVTPDRDGIMRNFGYGTVTAGVVRPSMPAMLAGAAGTLDGSFPVNTSISPSSLPIHSISDILSGKVGRDTLSGKTVLIGATAIELGDRYAMPRHGVQPGVVIQALATETLLQGLVRTNFGAAPAIALSLLVIAMLAGRQRYVGIFATSGLVVITALPLVLELSGIGTVDVAAALCGYAAGAMTLIGSRAAGEFEQVRLIDAASGLPNQAALRRRLKTATTGLLVVMRIRNFDDIAHLISDDQRRMLVDQVCDRVALATGDTTLFSLGPGRIAWLEEDEDIDRLTDALDGLATVFTSRIAIGGQKLILTPSFGIARGRDRADPVYADLAASRAVTLGCRWVIYSEELGSLTGRAQQLLADLDEAMAAGDITLVYQPKLTLANSRIEGVEALVRWHHPTLGPIPPDQLIPILEDAGRMSDLTLYITDQCIRTIDRWQKAHLETGVAVNISAPLLSDQSFVSRLIARVKAMGPRARLLTLEITESAVVLSDASTIDALAMLRRAGVRVAIDDYGTGQSTLSYLKKFKADEIKIDKSFVRNLVDEESDRILVRSTISMAHEMGLKVVAEGVEDAACCEALRAYGCDLVQGWFISKGVPEHEMEAMLSDNRASTPAEAVEVAHHADPDGQPLGAARAGVR